jgi:flagella basal body P-ring formation protein FlgA
MRFLLPLLAVLLVPFAAAGQAPALLRPHAVVHGPQVLLSDIFVDAPAQVAFASPPPGRRIVLEPRDIAALARAGGLAWRPAPGADRVIVERPGQLLARASAETALRSALVPLGAGGDDGFDLATPLPIVPASMEPFLAAEDAVFDRASGRFAATLVLDHGEGQPQRVRIVGRIWAGVPAAVPTRRITAGQVLQAEDFRIERVRADRAAGLIDPDAVAGLAARRPLAAGQPLAERDLGRPAVVAKNAAVMMAITMPGMSIAAQGRALQDGAIGETIRVQNVASRAVLEAEVVGPGRVRIATNSLPVERPAPGQTPSVIRR